MTLPADDSPSGLLDAALAFHDAGWIPDDDDAHVQSVTIRRDPEPGPHMVTITVESTP